MFQVSTNKNCWIHDWKYWEKNAFPVKNWSTLEKFFITIVFCDPRITKDGKCKFCCANVRQNNYNYYDNDYSSDDEFWKEYFYPHFFWCKKFVKTLMERLLKKANKQQRKFNLPEIQEVVLVESFGVLNFATERLTLRDPSAYSILW